MHKILPWLIFIFFAGLAGFVVLNGISQFEKTISYQPPPLILTKEKSIEIILVGDIMLDRGVEYQILKNGQGDFKFPFLKIADYLKTADIVFGNLEGPISDKGTKVGSIYSFRDDPKAIDGLTFAGFNILSLANNHAFDYGRTALEDTFLKLKTADIDYVGAGFNASEAESPTIKTVNGTKIGFLAFTDLGSSYWQATENNSGINWIGEEDKSSSSSALSLRESLLIQEAKKRVDVLIVSLHAGEEYKKEPTQFQIDFAKMVIDAGADLVVGSHPHVVQLNEIYPSAGSGQVGYVFYSLGNFIFDQSFSSETMQGEVVKIEIQNKKIKTASPQKIKINNFYQPELTN